MTWERKRQIAGLTVVFALNIMLILLIRMLG